MIDNTLLYGHLSRAFLLGITLLLPLSSTELLAAESKAERAQTLVIGKVSMNPKKHFNYLKPMVDYAAAKMQDLGINRVKVLMAKDNAQMIRYLKQGKIDWITETVFSSVEFEEKANAEMLLLKHKKGVPSYHSIFFARQGSDIQSLQDLKGKVIAFEDPGSSSGFLIPAALMLDAGLELVQMESPRESAPAHAVGYVFAKAEINMSTWVHKGIVDAAAFANLDWENVGSTPVAFKDDLYIFHKSGSFPRAIELVRKGLDAKVKQRLKSILLAIKDDPLAKEILFSYQRTTDFDEIDEQVKKGIERARAIKITLENELDL